MSESPSRCEHERVPRVVVAVVLALIAAPVHVAAAADPCRLEILGTWAPSYATAGSERIVLSFAEDGWATLLAGPPERPIWDYEMLGAVRYELAEPGFDRIDFTARRAIEVFPGGSSSWLIGSYGDERFSAQKDASSEETHWTRVPAQRYFVSLAAGSALGEGAGDVPAAFVAWTQIDERRTRLQALGAYPGPRSGEARFGRIPETLSQAFAADSEDDTRVLLRIELNEAQFRRSYEVFEAWDVLVRHELVDERDPHLHAMEVVAGAVQSVNRCSTSLSLGGRRFNEAVQRPWEFASTGGAPAATRVFDFIDHIARVNEAVHVAEEALSAPNSLPPE